jgi:hypothetical protein
MRLTSGSCQAQPPVLPPPTPAEVQSTIDRLVQFLLDGQRPDGGWPEVPSNKLGVSSLATLALLNAGQEPDSPAMSRALRYVGAEQAERTYAISLQTMALAAANPNKFATAIEANIKWLIKTQVAASGGWGYGDGGEYVDPSCSQFALLALHEAQRVGVAIPEAIRKRSFDAARLYWRRIQGNDGGFSYPGTDSTSGSMTCAAISSLIIVGPSSDQGSLDRLECCGSSDNHQARIEKALQWMGNNFSVHTNPGARSGYYLYYMYGLERAARLAGRRYFNTQTGRGIERIDWYREGSRHLIKILRDGVNMASGSTHGSNEYCEAAFALLFLAKGKRQVVVNRLEYGKDMDWQRHPMAVQHLVGHTEQAWRRDLTWQSVQLEQAKVEDLLEAPVLYISGSRAPQFTNQQKLLLKRYVEQGGFIFAEACNGNGCQGIEFEEYFKRLVVELFEQPLEKLSPDHPIWSAEAKVDPKDLPEGTWLYGVQSCCRLGLVYAPYALSCRWQLNLPYGNKPDYSAAVQSDLNTSTKLGVNVLSYATGKELKEKLQTVSVLKEVQRKTTTDRGLFLLPVLAHNAGADDAPKSVKTLVEWLNQENPFQMSSEKRMVPIEKQAMKQHPVIYVHGRGKFQLDSNQREAQRSYFEGGGTLVGDAICGDQLFAESFRAEIEKIAGNQLEKLPVNHPALSNRYYGFDLKELSIIDPSDSQTGSAVRARKIAPWVEAGRYEDRIVVLFSPLDISCALESKHSLQCKGYVREDAAKLGINMVLFALQQ